MARKPARMYRAVKGQAYTRKEYMGGVPNPRITQFEHGTPDGDFEITASLIVKEQCQIRHTALEAARISANRYLQKKLGVTNYHLKIRIYPHHVLRENKQATGAGADRVSQGMRKAFGKAVGTAARVKAGQKVMTVRINRENFKAAKDALRKAGMKMPSPTIIAIEKGEDLVA